MCGSTHESAREEVEHAVEEFNRYHGAEARARIIEWLDDGFKVKFEGSFCLTCGFYDYFDDLAFVLREKGYSVEVAGVEEIEGGAVVEYKFTSEWKPRKSASAKLLILEWRREEP